MKQKLTVYLTSGEFVNFDELWSRVLSGEVLHSYFISEDDVIYCDQVDATNINNVMTNPKVKESEGLNKMYGYDMIYHEYKSPKGGRGAGRHKGKWVFCHRLVDQYNLRTGVYASLKPESRVVHHLDKNKKNNNPDNLVRLTSKEHTEYHLEDSVDTMLKINEKYKDKLNRQRSARSARTRKSREYGRLLLTAKKIYDSVGDISERIYEENKYKFSSRPAKWSRLMEETLGSEESLRVAVANYGKNLSEINESGKITIYAAGPFFNPTQVATIRDLETFLEDRGYSVFSPSRDGVKLVPNSSPEDRMRVFEDNVTHCNGSDLVIAVIDDKDSGTMVELGMRYSHWRSMKDSGVEPYATQECPRIITFSNQGYDVNLMILGLTLCHCKGFEELNSYLDYVDTVGLENAKQSDSVHKLGFI